MSSISLLSLYSPIKVQRFQQTLNHRKISPLFSPSLRKSNGFSFQLRNSRSLAPKFVKSVNFAFPFTWTAHSSKGFIQNLARKAAILLLGSFFFLGFCDSQPVLALPTATVSSQLELEDEKMLEKVLESEPGNMEAIKAILYRKMRRGKSKDALKYVEKLISIEPHEVEWKLLKALCYETMGEMSKAKRLLKDILEEKPLLIRALHSLAMVMHKNHEDSSIFDMLNEAMEIAKQRDLVTEERNIQVLIGQMHTVKGQYKEGLKIFKQMVNDNPRDFRPYLCQGIVYSLMDKKEEAAKQFEIYWSLVPEEFPQKGFLDDVALAAQVKSQERLQNTFKAKSMYRS